MPSATGAEDIAVSKMFPQETCRPVGMTNIHHSKGKPMGLPSPVCLENGKGTDMGSDI